MDWKLNNIIIIMLKAQKEMIRKWKGTSRAWLKRLKFLLHRISQKSSSLQTGLPSLTHCWSTGRTEAFGFRITWMRWKRVSGHEDEEEEEEERDLSRVLTESEISGVKNRELFWKVFFWNPKAKRFADWFFTNGTCMCRLNQDPFLLDS